MNTYWNRKGLFQDLYSWLISKNLQEISLITFSVIYRQIYTHNTDDKLVKLLKEFDFLTYFPQTVCPTFYRFVLDVLDLAKQRCNLKIDVIIADDYVEFVVDYKNDTSILVPKYELENVINLLTLERFYDLCGQIPRNIQRKTENAILQSIIKSSQVKDSEQ